MVLGSGGVGKSCLTIRYVSNKFIPDYDPTVEDTFKKHVQIEEIPEEMKTVDEESGSRGWSVFQLLISVKNLFCRQTREETPNHLYAAVSTNGADETKGM